MQHSHIRGNTGKQHYNTPIMCCVPQPSLVIRDKCDHMYALSCNIRNCGVSAPTNSSWLVTALQNTVHYNQRHWHTTTSMQHSNTPIMCCVPHPSLVVRDKVDHVYAQPTTNVARHAISKRKTPHDATERRYVMMGHISLRKNKRMYSSL
jgi:hypothetical protein